MRQIVGSIPIQGNEIFNISISSPWWQKAALSSQLQMPPQFGGKWGAECLNTRFPLPTLLLVGYSIAIYNLKKIKGCKRVESVVNYVKRKTQKVRNDMKNNIIISYNKI